MPTMKKLLQWEDSLACALTQLAVSLALTCSSTSSKLRSPIMTLHLGLAMLLISLRGLSSSANVRWALPPCLNRIGQHMPNISRFFYVVQTCNLCNRLQESSSLRAYQVQIETKNLQWAALWHAYLRELIDVSQEIYHWYCKVDCKLVLRGPGR